jgi:superfamily I DNA/RNA helicase
MSNQQKYDEIVSSTSSVICVVAGPGSGKTKGILTPKIKNILSGSNIAEDKVLLLTFSRASAQDLKQQFEGEEKSPRISTLHSLCLSFLLSEDNHDIRKRVDSILLDFEKDVLIADIKQRAPEFGKRRIKKMLDEFSAGWATLPHDKVFVEDEDKRKFKGIVVDWLDEHEAAMMEEIVYHAVDLAKKIESSFIDDPEYILVDEFQDLNRLEQKFVELLSNKSKLLLVVGDPDQSIYSFKYAHPQGINDFSSKDEVDSHSLEYIGRSAKKIVNLANELLKQADPTRTSLLKPLPDKEDGSVNIQRFDTQDIEFESVFNEIDKMISNGEKPEEILILVPRKKLGVEFVRYANDKLQEKQYSYHVISKVDFSQTEKERILLFGLLSNPKSILHIRSYIGLYEDDHFSAEIEAVKTKYGSLIKALNQANPDDFNSRKQRVKKLCNKLIELRNFLSTHADTANVHVAIDELFPENNLELNDLRKIIISLVEDNDTVSKLYTKLVDYMRTIQSDDNQIKVMTLISSKGLEANHVYILGCNDGNMPGKNRSSYLDDYQNKQEQRRLLYVGITRAKKTLTITWCQHIPFEQAMGSHTSSIGVRTINGKKYSRVGLSEFLQDIVVEL